MKLLTKKEVKAFIENYHKIIEIMCEVWNLQRHDTGPWQVGDLVPELAVINNIFIAIPNDEQLDVIQLGKESKSAIMEMVRANPKILWSKKHRKKLLKKLKKE